MAYISQIYSDKESAGWVADKGELEAEVVTSVNQARFLMYVYMDRDRYTGKVLA